jgi:hypothetical protein
MDKEPSVHQLELMAALDFTADDLAANRAGVLSEWQQRKSHEEARKVERMGSIFIVFSLVLTATVLTIQGYRAYEGDSGSVLTAVILLILVLGGVGYWIKSRSLTSATQAPTPVGMAEGRVTVRVSSDSYDMFDEIFVGDNNIKLQTRKSGRAFMAGGRYRIYYQPFTNEILSAEWAG